MGLRYVLQAGVMVGDLMVFAAIAFLLWEAGNEPGVWLLAALALWAWKGSGGLMAWKPAVIRRFMANARALGL